LTYEEAVAAHRWNVPERYNIAADVCDKHPREKAAMIWERFDGARRDVRKIKGAGPGMVTYRNERTIAVRPSDALIERTNKKS
jgi:hypothetical protein